MGYAIVPLDRALLSSAFCNGLAAICSANFDWGFRSPTDPQIPPSRAGTGAPVSHSVTWDHVSVPAKWHLIPTNGLRRLNECDKHTDRQADGRTTLWDHLSK